VANAMRQGVMESLRAEGIAETELEVEAATLYRLLGW
jgi:hypothetical protein